MHAGGTPSLTNNNDKVSYASLLDAIGKALAHPKSLAYTCALLLPLLDTVLANIVSVFTLQFRLELSKTDLPGGR